MVEHQIRLETADRKQWKLVFMCVWQVSLDSRCNDLARPFLNTRKYAGTDL